MIVERMTVGALEANCYIVACESSRKAIVIDPGDDAQRIARLVRENHYAVEFIVNTHGHFDHIGGNDRLKKEFSTRLAIHSLDANMLCDPAANLSALVAGGRDVNSLSADRLLSEGDRIEAGTVVLTVIHTPGHTPGSICLFAPGTLFSGDTLFMNGVGRTDLPGGDPALLYESLENKVFALSDDVRVYPGHGPETAIGQERLTWPTQL